MDVEMAMGPSGGEDLSESDAYDGPYDDCGRVWRPTNAAGLDADSDASYSQPSAEDSS